MRAFFIVAALALTAASCGVSDRASVQRIAAPPSISQSALYPRFSDSNPSDWAGRTPHSYPIHGVDVSRWQGDVDWHRVRDAGVSFAFLKATEGGDLSDPMFETYWSGTKDAGIQRSAYHFFYFCRPAVEQARWFIRNVPRDRNALPHVLDLEWNPHSPTCRIRPDGATVRAEARRFLDLLEAHYGRRPIIYTTIDFYEDTGIGQLRGTEYWLRSVARHPSEAYPGKTWTFWQYSGTGRVPGIEGPVDLNVFSQSPEAWVRWSG
ncbi:MAG: GH25 family lysozyme [Pseudomonadota bacterium]